MRVLVLGGYGLIGLEIVRGLKAAGFDVVGLGRSAAIGRRAAPDIAWIGVDIATLRTAESWRPHLQNIDAVVNAAGALQDGARDNLHALQDAICALVVACVEGNVERFIQISAPGADIHAPTAFMRTKGVADAAVRASGLNWIIFKPGLVISANAYGGTALLRMLAAFPWVQPLTRGERRLQTVAAADVADAVVFALKGLSQTRRDYDLVEASPHSLRDIVGKLRAWLGAPLAPALDLPAWSAAPIALLADTAGWLGWRSPLRSTALRVLDNDVIGDGAPWTAARGRPLKSLDETLASLPATAQERLYARAQLALPILVVSLSAFWLASGLIALAQRGDAARVLAGAMGPGQAMALVFAGAVIDIAIGAAVLVRPLTRPAAIAAIAVSLIYLALATWLTPHLWADPLGPLVKIIPAVALALAVAALTGER